VRGILPDIGALEGVYLVGLVWLLLTVGDMEHGASKALILYLLASTIMIILHVPIILPLLFLGASCFIALCDKSIEEHTNGH